MLEAKVHKEITEYEGKIFFGMTGKQIICVLIAFAIVIPVFFIFKDILGIEATGYVCIFIAAPIMAIGFFKYKGRTFTEIVRLIFNYELKPKKSVLYNVTLTDYLVQEESNAIYKKEKNKKYKECIESLFRYKAGSKKQLRAKRKEIRKHLTAFKKEYTLQQEKRTATIK